MNLPNPLELGEEPTGGKSLLHAITALLSFADAMILLVAGGRGAENSAAGSLAGQFITAAVH